MHARVLLIASVVLMLAGAAITSMGTMDRAASFEAASQMWSEVWWDAGRGVHRASRLPAQQEMEIGARLAEPWNSQPMPAEHTRYVAAIGERLRPHVQRKDIVYRFRVLDIPEVNAFALPGGHIFLFRGLMEQLTSEAQLAAVIGHEMAHVDLYHAVDHARGPGMSFIYSQDQEREADQHGQKLAIEAGYDPRGLIDAMTVFDNLYESFRAPTQPANSPVQEVEQATRQSLNDFFRTHPPSADRASRLRALVAAQQTKLKGKQFCVGVENLKLRQTCAELAIDREQVSY